MLIDGVGSTVGSTNMDLWSFMSNDEVNAVILGQDFATKMEADRMVFLQERRAYEMDYSRTRNG